MKVFAHAHSGCQSEQSPSIKLIMETGRATYPSFIALPLAPCMLAPLSPNCNAPTALLPVRLLFFPREGLMRGKYPLLECLKFKYVITFNVQKLYIFNDFFLFLCVLCLT